MRCATARRRGGRARPGYAPRSATRSAAGASDLDGRPRAARGRADGPGRGAAARSSARCGPATGSSPPPAGSRATCSSCGTRRPGSFTHIEFGFSCMGHEIPAGAGHPPARGRRPRGLRRHRRRHLPDEPDRARDRGPGGPEDHRRRPRQRRLPVDQPACSWAAPAPALGNEFRHRGADGRFPDGERVAVDFVANARSMGCEAVLAETRRRARRRAARPPATGSARA